MNIVISQPMLFPWVGMFEQIRLADIYVHYDDVQFSKGSFTSRVQIKTPDGFKWLIIPLKDVKLGKNINEYETNNKTDWRNQHLEFLKQIYKKAPFFNDMFQIVNKVYALPTNSLTEILIFGLDEVTQYLGFHEKREFYKSSELTIKGTSSERVFDIVNHFKGTNYITGHGAKNYLDHQLFEKNKVEVIYMDYQKKPYPQLYGEFNPYISILDLIANVGKEATQYIISGTQSWKTIIQ
jgi:hypothetical protein